MSIKFKEPLNLDYDNMDTQQVIDIVMDSIEQSDKFNPELQEQN